MWLRNAKAFIEAKLLSIHSEKGSEPTAMASATLSRSAFSALTWRSMQFR